MTPSAVPGRAPLLAGIAVFGALAALGACLFPEFATPRVAVHLICDGTALGVAALGATFVILAGGIDLSVGAMAALSSVVIARLVMVHDAAPLTAFVAAAALGLALGAGQGAVITLFRLPPFLVTLIGMFFARGLAFAISDASLAIDPSALAGTPGLHLRIPVAAGAGLPLTAAIFIAAIPAAAAILARTPFGRRVHAVGSDEGSAALMGLPVRRTKIAVYAISGLGGAGAGIVWAVDMQSGNPAGFPGFELDVIAAVVIGGTRLAGGAGSAAGTAIGVLTLGIVQTLITFDGRLDSWWARIVIGALLLLFLLGQGALEGAIRRLTARPPARPPAGPSGGPCCRRS